MSWLIEGAMKVVAADFKVDRPQCVLDAIGAYREGNDWLGSFIDECCDVDASYQEKSGELYKRYRELGGKYCTLGSDAHYKEHVGRRLQEALALAAQAELTPVYFKARRMQIMEGLK